MPKRFRFSRASLRGVNRTWPQIAGAAIAILVLLASATLCAAAESSPVADLQRHVDRVLTEGTSTAVDCQRTLATALRMRAEAPSGVAASGRGVGIEDLSPARAQAEWLGDETPRAAVRVTAQGPDPIRITIPLKDTEEKALTLYRRVDRGLYVQTTAPAKRVGSCAVFETSHPGDFVLRDEAPAEAEAEAEKGFFDADEVSADPAARVDWGLYRVRPRRVNGPIPLILIHGLEADRWAEFIEWAAWSREAAAFREAYQLWDFYHDASGVNAPVGYSKEYEAFDLSIVAALDRYITQATEEGFVTGSDRYFLPEGPMALITHSAGGPKARAFMMHYPERAERVLAAVTISAPHTGLPFGTPEWLSHTITRVGTATPLLRSGLLQGLLAETITASYMRIDRQSDLDMGWGNFDAAGGFGIPTLNFEFWKPGRGIHLVMLSPRDANQTDARLLPGYEDTTAEPQALLSTYCGGMDEIMPPSRGAYHLDKFFIYCSYLERPWNWLDLLEEGEEKAFQRPEPNGWASCLIEDFGLRLAQQILALVATPGTDVPLGVYSLNDGLIPMQSQALLDGTETEFVFETEMRNGFEYPVIPYRHREDVIRAHTLANPNRLRILRGWNHRETGTGRYNWLTGHSDLFSMVAEDLLSVVPESDE